MSWYEDGYDSCYGCPFYGKFRACCNNCEQDIETIKEDVFNNECNKADDAYYKNKN